MGYHDVPTAEGNGWESQIWDHGAGRILDLEAELVARPRFAVVDDCRLEAVVADPVEGRFAEDVGGVSGDG